MKIKVIAFSITGILLIIALMFGVWAIWKHNDNQRYEPSYQNCPVEVTANIYWNDSHNRLQADYTIINKTNKIINSIHFMIFLNFKYNDSRESTIRPLLIDNIINKSFVDKVNGVLHGRETRTIECDLHQFFSSYYANSQIETIEIRLQICWVNFAGLYGQWGNKWPFDNLEQLWAEAPLVFEESIPYHLPANN
ncbi:MAG: hypothetical protein FWF37_02185 [Chloroflexi bacterium]|nr:hypothetical protein [Chloroflexota bacterium]